jgi:addiction module HigA family antidote
MRDKDKSLTPIHPGEILRSEFMEPMGITQYRLAKDLSVQPLRISEIVRGKRGITADTALRLGRYFGLSATYWMNLQALYEIEIAEDRMQDRLEKEVKPRGGLAA